MSEVLATVYAFGFHKPKPLHRLIVRNWSTAKAVRFIFVTDHGRDWLDIIPEGTTNIQVHQIDVEHLFELAFPLLGVRSFTELKRDRGWLFTAGDFQMGGYLGCQLRPALSTLLPQQRTRFWGWIDNDVLIDGANLEHHLRHNQSSLLLFPAHGYAWEQFKLFSTELNTTMIYREMVDLFLRNTNTPPGPMEARFVYHIRDMRRYSLDDPAQSQMAIHWSWLDKVAQEKGLLPNQYPVRISSDAASLSGPDNQRVLFFNADTQVKVFSEDTMAQIDADMGKAEGYNFQYEPRL